MEKRKKMKKRRITNLAVIICLSLWFTMGALAQNSDNGILAGTVRDAAHALDRAAAGGPQRVQVVHRHVLIAPPRLFVIVEARKIFDREFLQTEGVGPDVGDLFVHVFVESLDQRHD